MLRGDPKGLFDPEAVPRAVSAVEVATSGANFEGPRHSHPQGQLVMGVKGLVSCEVADTLWMVPPQCAVWVPGGMMHSVRGAGDLDLHVLFIDAGLVPGLPGEAGTLSVSPLLRELVAETARLPRLWDRDGAAGRLVRTMLDQLAAAPFGRLHLPLPADGRLRRIANGLAADPSDRATVGEWARRVGVSERTLSRLLPLQTGMSFVRWRRQFHVALALERLRGGEAVQAVAYDLGYESASAFIAMFRKVLGESPGRYLGARRSAGRRSHPRPGLADERADRASPEALADRAGRPG